MDAILRRLPTQESLHRRRAALAGFAFGIALMVLGGLFVQTVYTGKGIGHVAPELPAAFID